VIVEASLTKHSPVQMLETRPHKRAGRSTSACAPFVRGANFHAQLLNNANLATLGPQHERQRGEWSDTAQGATSDCSHSMFPSWTLKMTARLRMYSRQPRPMHWRKPTRSAHLLNEVTITGFFVSAARSQPAWSSPTTSARFLGPALPMAIPWIYSSSVCLRPFQVA